MSGQQVRKWSRRLGMLGSRKIRHSQSIAHLYEKVFYDLLLLCTLSSMTWTYAILYSIMWLLNKYQGLIQDFQKMSGVRQIYEWKYSWLNWDTMIVMNFLTRNIFRAEKMGHWRTGSVNVNDVLTINLFKSRVIRAFFGDSKVELRETLVTPNRYHKNEKKDDEAM